MKQHIVRNLHLPLFYSIFLRHFPLFVVLFFWAFQGILAQGPPQSRQNMPRIGKITGRVMDSSLNQPMNYAQIQLLGLTKDTLWDASFTNNRGDFLLENIPPGSYRLLVKSLGFQSQIKKVTITFQNAELELGEIMLMPDEKTLGNITLEGRKSAMTMGIDRKIFNVDRNINSQGGTARDILKNVPSVTVDNEGTVLLRNTTTQIYIDGRPATLSIDQIPADQIERIEIITNPSARFEASATGGILNLVMKRSNKPGTNGVASIGGGTGGRYNGMINLSVKTKKFTYSGSYTTNAQWNPNIKGFTYRDNLENGQFISGYRQDNLVTFGNRFQFARLGLTYNPNIRNSITINQNFVMGRFNVRDVQTYQLLNNQRESIENGTRENLTNNGFNNYTVSLNWRKTFPQKGKELITDISYNQVASKTWVSFLTQGKDPVSGQLLSGYPLYQVNDGRNGSQMGTAQLDYFLPVNDSTKWEMGFRSFFKFTDTRLNANFLNYQTGTYISSSSLSSNYAFLDLVNAVYINYQKKMGNWGYQAGFRFEQSYFEGDPRNDTQNVFKYSFPGKTITDISRSLFPSLFLTRKLSDNQEIQWNYSRKLNRPGFMQMMPLILFADRQNIRIGNPRLTPEFINLMEINYQAIYKKGSWLASLYGKSVGNPLTNFAYPSPDDSSILINTTINGNTQFAVGFDNSWKVSINKNWEWNINANGFLTRIDAVYDGISYKNTGFNWTGKFTTIYKIKKSLSAQFSGNYESPRIIPQGLNRANYFLDFSLLKEFGKMASINLTVSDIFNTRRFGTILETPDFTQDYSRRRETRYVKITALWRFGEADTFVRKKPSQRNSNTEGMEF